MKDLHKNPVFYYVLIPLLVAAWPLLMWFKYLPAAQKALQQQIDDIPVANDLITEILTLDPDRLNYAKNAQGDTVEFSYGDAIPQAAKTCSIRPPTVREKPKVGKVQAADVTLKDVDIVRCAKFLSTLQLHWSRLQCTQIKLSAKKGLKDRWDVSMTFNYTF